MRVHDRRQRPPLRRRHRLGLILTGIVLMYAAFLAQATSRLTPLLAVYPPIFAVMSNLGAYLSFLSLVWSAYSFQQSRRAFYLCSLVASATALTAILVTVWGDAFQLGIAGVLVGGELLAVGVSRHHYRN